MAYSEKQYNSTYSYILINLNKASVCSQNYVNFMQILTRQKSQLNKKNKETSFSYASAPRGMNINIYHKGCGTMGVPVFASENIDLHLRLILKNTSGKIS